MPKTRSGKLMRRVMKAGQMLARRKLRPLMQQSFEELNENYHIVCGKPDTVLEQLKYLQDRLGVEHLIMYGQESRMSHEPTMDNIGLFGKEVLPVIRDWLAGV